MAAWLQQQAGKQAAVLAATQDKSLHGHVCQWESKVHMLRLGIGPGTIGSAMMRQTHHTTALSAGAPLTVQPGHSDYHSKARAVPQVE